MPSRKSYPRAHNRESSQPAHDAEAIDISAADAVPTLQESGTSQFWRSLYVGTGGDVKVDTLQSTAIIFKAFPGGQFLPCYVTKVYKVGTTASNLIGLV